ncbi:hypothetical protein CVT24_007730 [Panaeolus cyanescens]|uniref:Uncharacterized protein n=1 Tax=Panaeolus cyanescens TaxID=181874 RepID=A0A409YKL2_9AGAR|nr:hypothetical protein CVT24_007730 [Panaeolus cyanescens]
MMQYASVGVRNATRKASNLLVHNKAHHGNAPGSSTAVNSRRTIHLSTNLFSASSSSNGAASLPSIRPRNPAHKLFSASKNFLQQFITHLTTPGFRVPTFLNDAVRSSRSLYTPHLQRVAIQNGFSLPARHALQTNALRRQANTFLPRGNGPVPTRYGGVSQVGLNTARNFSTGRPIFQHLAENVPVACRALYEADLDLKCSAKRRALMRDLMKPTKSSTRLSEKAKAKPASIVSLEAFGTASPTTEDLEHYFALNTPSVSTYLLIPLAPTPTSRIPLPLNAVDEDVHLLPPLSQLGAIRTSHSTHAMRVSALFMRLDQANVWSRGVTCSAYSQGSQYHQRVADSLYALKDDEIDTGTCTILKVEFIGWTKAEVRGVIGESGSGWCALEEVWHNDGSDGYLSDTDSISSSPLEEQATEFVDPAQSLVLPIPEDSISDSSSHTSSYDVSTGNSGLDEDPWADLFFSRSTSPHSSPLFVDPPSINGFYQGTPDNHIGLVFSSGAYDRQSSPRGVAWV